MRLYDMEMEDEPDVWVWSWTWPGCVNWARLGFDEFDEIVRPARRLVRFHRIVRRLVDAETTTEESWREHVELEAGTP